MVIYWVLRIVGQDQIVIAISVDEDRGSYDVVSVRGSICLRRTMIARCIVRRDTSNREWSKCRGLKVEATSGK